MVLIPRDIALICTIFHTNAQRAARIVAAAGGFSSHHRLSQALMSVLSHFFPKKLSPRGRPISHELNPDEKKHFVKISQ